jgi:hypothetical protein
MHFLRSRLTPFQVAYSIYLPLLLLTQQPYNLRSLHHSDAIRVANLLQEMPFQKEARTIPPVQTRGDLTQRPIRRHIEAPAPILSANRSRRKQFLGQPRKQLLKDMLTAQKKRMYLLPLRNP